MFSLIGIVVTGPPGQPPPGQGGSSAHALETLNNATKNDKKIVFVFIKKPVTTGD